MLKNYAVCNVQCSEFFIFILRNPSQRLHLTVFLKAFISKGVRYLTVKKSSIEQYINWYGHDLLCIPITSCSFLHNERKWWPQLSLVPIRLHCTDEIRVSSWCSWNGVSLIHCLPLSLSHTQMVLCIYFQCPFRARAMNWPFHRYIGGCKSHWTWLVANTVYRAIPPNFFLPLQGHWHVFTLKAQTLFIWPLISN